MLTFKGISFVTTSTTKAFYPIYNTLQTRNYAARKGTRERARKKKVKVEVEKVGFVIPDKKEKERAKYVSQKVSETWKKDTSFDNVYFLSCFKQKVYPFKDAVQCHREILHPTVYNLPDSLLKVRVELNMAAAKKNRTIDNFARIAPVAFPFDHGEERTILAFTKSESLQQQARDAGALLTGGTELIKDIQFGKISLQDFQFILAHPHILPELVVLRGLMRKRFPTPKNGTLSADLVDTVKRFVSGIRYSAQKEPYEPDFGVIETVLGPLSSDPQGLEDNFSLLVRDINSVRPKREGDFITRCLLLCPPSREKLKVSHEVYLPLEEEVDDEDDVDEEEEEVKAVA